MVSFDLIQGHLGKTIIMLFATGEKRISR